MKALHTIKVALVGCGQIADAHLQQIRRIKSARIVGVCDLEPLLARQAAERFGVPNQFTCVDAMLAATAPDVVHVTTPVDSHADLAIHLLNAGVHVYVEKPFTLDATQARQVLQTARRCERHVCLGHDQLFDPTWLRACDLVRSGTIGSVKHVDSTLCYPLAGPFGRNVMNNPDHWVHSLPGGLFQNTISHPLYRITEFLTDTHPYIQGSWFTTDPTISFPTELRAHLRGQTVTGSLYFTSSVKPHRRITTIYGTLGTLIVNLDTQIVRVDQGERLPGALSPIEAAVRQCVVAGGDLRRTLSRFLRCRIHYFEGMKTTFERFYQAILEGTDPPVPATESLRVTAIMDRIFDHCSSSDTHQSPVHTSLPPKEPREEFRLTGSPR